MIIANSSIGMDSVRTYTSVSMESKNFSVGAVVSFKDKIKEADGKEGIGKTEKEKEETKAKEENAKKDFDSIYERMKSFATSGALENKLEVDAMNRIKVQCIQYLLCILFGREIGDDEIMLTGQESGGNNLRPISYYTYEESQTSFFAEVEETSFNTNGKVVTADGREIDFNLEVSMSRSFASYYEEKISVTKAFVDPLVINLEEAVADVSDIKVKFDLDCDGQEEEISALSPQSGYLALDLNDDGIINDGSELFGTSSGDGFADLSKYDRDHNGWIDEADDIFDKLKICVLDEKGNQSLYSLKEKNVGAIGLANTNTEFSLNSLSTNETNARIRKTGIFLYENGGVGTIQHLDLAQ